MRSRITWLKEGDTSTQFFYAHASYKRKKNHILRLNTEHGLATTHEEKAQALFEHFSNVLGTEVERTHSINLAALGVASMDMTHLENLFTEEELWSAIKALPTDKAPGPDGFTVEFYRSAWDIIKDDLILALQAFNRADNRGLRGINNALITLLPKTADANEPADYRPICLIHSFAKNWRK